MFSEARPKNFPTIQNTCLLPPNKENWTSLSLILLCTYYVSHHAEVKKEFIICHLVIKPPSPITILYQETYTRSFNS